ncbi:cation-transporting atpase [Anaeramoeba ignava]|uniref:Cation-transporting ATPase n=1 Tax=Anaeramoeba ignava TaxID=1746090 RepID=A0A9Q0LC72_ANAIG|nr:cation-transporting atpase [Anaeramoeba ignava]
MFQNESKRLLNEEKQFQAKITDIEEDGTIVECELRFYRKSKKRTTFFVIIAILTVGFSLLLCHWFRKLKLKGTHKKVDSYQDAHKFLILRPDKTYDIVNQETLIYKENGLEQEKSMIKYRYIHYIFNEEHNQFIRVGLNSSKDFSKIRNKFSDGLNNKEIIKKRQALFGQNYLNIPVKSYPALLLSEVLHPLFVFQLFAVIVWSVDNYAAYGITIMVMSLVTIFFSLRQTKKNLVTLSEMAKFDIDVEVFRIGEYKTISSKDLVPGDLVSIPNNFILPGDFILLNGQCIVNESMLTGESVPVVKTSLPSDTKQIYDIITHKKYTLYSGTKVIESKFYSGNRVLAVLVRSGFDTMKGSLVRSILFPKPHNFKFYSDTFKYLFFLTFISFIGFAISAVYFVKHKNSVYQIVIQALELITIVVPPCLPIVLTTGTGFAIERLKKNSIHCISPPRVNVAGKLNLLCFDKTGTLTTDQLEVLGVHPCSGNEFDKLEQTFIKKEINIPEKLMNCLSCCHSLSKVEKDLIGDPLEIKMFEWIGWELEELDQDQETNLGFDSPISTFVKSPKFSIKNQLVTQNSQDESEDDEDEMKLNDDENEENLADPINININFNNNNHNNHNNNNNNHNNHNTDKNEKSDDKTKDSQIDNLFEQNTIGIIHAFDFSSTLQRMSVIVSNQKTGNFEMYAKGSPEKIKQLCIKESIPKDYETILHSYTKEGFRVIALGYKLIENIEIFEMKTIPRDSIEKDLIFLGFFIMENKLKDDTIQVIQELKKALFYNVMITGDNPLTAISVGKKCEIIEPNSTIFLGNQKKKGQTKIIEWENIDNPNEFFDLSKNVMYYKNSKNEKNEEIEIQLSSDSNDENEEEIQIKNENIKNIELVVTGKVYSTIKKRNPELFERMLIQSHIFSRMSPDQKSQLIGNFQELGYVVGMCGDGANDVKALKSAHVGISLANTEASIAAPFTSRKQTIQSVIDVIREGRCSLISSFQSFKFISLYALIQFLGVVQLYILDSNLTTYQFVYVDLFLVLPLSVIMTRTPASKKLVQQRPASSLISLSVVTSLLGHLIFILLFEIIAVLIVRKQSFYEPIYTNIDEEEFKCYEDTVLFLICNFQTLIILVVVNRSKPFKHLVWKSPLYTVVIIICFVVSAYLLIYPDSLMRKIFEIYILGWKYKIILSLLILLDFMVEYILEKFILSKYFKKMKKCCYKKKKITRHQVIRQISLQSVKIEK